MGYWMRIIYLSILMLGCDAPDYDSSVFGGNNHTVHKYSNAYFLGICYNRIQEQDKYISVTPDESQLAQCMAELRSSGGL